MQRRSHALQCNVHLLRTLLSDEAEPSSDNLSCSPRQVDRGQKVRNEDTKPPETLPVSSVPYVDPCTFLHRCFAKAQHFGNVEAFFSQIPSGRPAECEGTVAVFADELCLERTADRYRCWETILQVL